MERTALYRTIWRWHFYAGLFVMPFILVLAITGGFYLFKPQVDRWEERAFHGLDASGAVSANVQLDAALAAFPGARLVQYRLPEQAGDAAMLTLGLAGGHGKRDVFVSPQGKVVGSLDTSTRIMDLDSKIHGQLFMGKKGGAIVELAASWAIVMILTGLYLWWPRGRGLAGTIWPRRGAFVRDLHAVTGFWVSTFALILLVSGLPWSSVWGGAFKSVRSEMGWVQGKQDWTIGGQASGEHAGHEGMDHGAMMTSMETGALDAIVRKARAENLAFPVLVKPPADKDIWTVQSDAQNRPLRTTITYEGFMGMETSRQTFADKHPIDRLIGYTTAWHEGQLLGWVNQLVGVMTALSLITLMITSFILWRRRKPAGKLGAPPLPTVPARIGGVVAILLILALFLPMLAASLVLLWVAETFVLPRFPKGRDWLGLPA